MEQTPAAQEPDRCSWQSIGTAGFGRFHVGQALDLDRNRLVVYGGLDEGFAPTGQVEELDLTGMGLEAVGRPLPVAAARDLAGAAGAYRPGSDPEGGAAYFFGGVADTAQGQAEDSIQRLDAASGAWDPARV